MRWLWRARVGRSKKKRGSKDPPLQRPGIRIVRVPPVGATKLVGAMRRLSGVIVGVVFDGDVADFLESHVAEYFAVFEDGFEDVGA